MDEQLVRDLTRVGRAVLDPQTPKQQRPTVEPSAPKFHKENAVVGVTLNDYTDRQPSEDGTYVKVVVHRERIELIEQPPTPEEIAQKKADQDRAFKIGAVLIGAGVVTVVTLGAVDVLKARARSGG